MDGGSTASRLQPLREGSLLFAIQFPDIPGNPQVFKKKLKHNRLEKITWEFLFLLRTSWRCHSVSLIQPQTGYPSQIYNTVKNRWYWKNKSRFCRYISYKEIFQHLLFSITPKHNNVSWLTLSNVSLQRKNEGTTWFS